MALPMSFHQQYCFKHNEEDVYLVTISNVKGSSVSITTYGAMITSFKIKMPDGSFNDIVLGFDKVEDYLSENYLTHYAYLGASCGRYANRIKNGKFTLDGKEYQLTQNMGNDQLHGGHKGFDEKVWKLKSVTDNSIELTYLSKDGEEGFPGNLETTIRFELNDNDELVYEFFATTDKPTAVNLTHHSYFNLNNGLGTIEEHEVKINSSAILAQDEGLVCNGELIAVENTIYDFRNFRAINKDWNKASGYDQCFAIDDKNEELSLVAEARSLQSGLTLQIFSTEPAVQFYTGAGLNSLIGKNGTQYKPFSGFCLETHKHPNAINIPHFPNSVLRPGEKYYQKNIYKIVQAVLK
jgi:aldose 1-epimerase